MKARTKEFITRLNDLLGEFEAAIEHRNSDDGLYVVVDGETANIGWADGAEGRELITAMLQEENLEYDQTEFHKKRWERWTALRNPIPDKP